MSIAEPDKEIRTNDVASLAPQRGAQRLGWSSRCDPFGNDGG
jgi:hypothetical protein